MNALEKLNALLSKDGRQIKYGAVTAETTFPLITLSIGESLSSSGHLGDSKAVTYPIIVVGVVSEDYMQGYNLSEQIKSEIKAAQKATLAISYISDLESEYNKETNNYTIKSKYKIINI